MEGESRGIIAKLSLESIRRNRVMRWQLLCDDRGKKIGQRKFSHGGTGLTDMIAWLLKASGGKAGEIHVAIETPHGPIVEVLLERGFNVYSINPKQLDRFRDRFTVSGAKDDSMDWGSEEHVVSLLNLQLFVNTRPFPELDNDGVGDGQLAERPHIGAEAVRQHSSFFVHHALSADWRRGWHPLIVHANDSSLAATPACACTGAQKARSPHWASVTAVSPGHKSAEGAHQKDWGAGLKWLLPANRLGLER
jgi:hypothetical protein